MNLTLKQLYAFKAVAEIGSFTRAAEQLGTVQPLLSTQIRDLERELLVKLFDRTTRRVELTDAGRQFLGDVEQLIGGLERAVNGVSDLARRQRGRLTVAAPPFLAAIVLPSVLAAFRAQNPGIEIGLIDRPTIGVLDAVRSRQADIGIGTFPAHVTDVARTILARDELMLFRAGSGGAGPPASWGDLAEEDLITLTPGSGIRSLVDQGLRASGVTRKPLLEVDQVATALALAAGGLGVTVLPAYAGFHAKLSCQPLGDPEISREISFVTPRDSSSSPATQAFIELLRPMVRRSQGGLFGIVERRTPAP